MKKVIRPRGSPLSGTASKKRRRPASQTMLKKDILLGAFSKLWSALFASPVHLDSLLSKQPPHLKSPLARMATLALLRPVSEAESFGVGVPPGQPWDLEKAARGSWRPAVLLADRVYASLSNPPQPSAAMKEDFPPRMIREWTAEWGEERCMRLVAELGREPPLSLRATRIRGGKDAAVKLLRELKMGSDLPVKAERSSLTPLGVRLGGYVPVLGHPSYAEGAFEIQDEGSQAMALFALWPEIYGKLLSGAPGPFSNAPVNAVVQPEPFPIPEGAFSPAALTVIDACAGAGGKSLALADLLLGRGRVYAYDISVTKLQALRRRATRAGVNNIQTVKLEEGKESEALGKFKASADVVLVDAPCSGWGVLRRNPDIKWRQEGETLARMPGIQLRLLTEYAQLVKPGGRLVFGVCTFRKDETTGVVEKFLEARPEFEAVAGGYLGPGPCDGFFMQAFRRKSA